MRKNRIIQQQNEFSILALDDDQTMTITLQAYFSAAGFNVEIENDPVAAIERIRNNNYDILLLDFLMTPVCGDQVVSRIREFNKTLFIILLTGHKSMAPPIKTIRELDIQGYYEKSDRFDQLELLVESCVKSIRQMRTIRDFRDGLRKILDSVPHLYQLQSIDQIMNSALGYTAGFLGSQNSCIYIETDEGQSSFAGSGKYAGDKQAGKVWYEAVCTMAYDPEEQDELVIPLMNESHEIFGVICAEPSDQIKDDALPLFSLYIKQVSGAICNAMLHSLINTKNEELEKTYCTLHDNYLDIISLMRSMVDARDIYTRGHSDRVSHYAQLIARALDKDSEYLDRIKVAGLFHDIGKISISDKILLKDSKLTPEEYEMVKFHAESGKQILSAVSLFKDIAPIVECHHERPDGKGYPHGLKDGNIPEESRIIGIADAFDAMTSNRSYARRLTLEQAIAELQRGKNTQFDSLFVDIFVKLLEDYEAIQEEVNWTYMQPDDVALK
ncbi:MAG: HD domain-containing phosphohydrolase [Christensenellales bacterium]